MKKALVTGASSGAGYAIATALAEQGYEVLALGRNPERLAKIGSVPGVTTVSADITDQAAMQGLVAAHEIDVLVNNAGLMPPLASFERSDRADIERTIQVNFQAQITLSRLVLPGMVERKSGHLVFIGSTAGHAPFANIAVYGATKAALGGFAQALRLDVAEHDIRVTEIVAGRIETDLYNDILPQDAREKMYEGGVALKPEDIAEAVSFALSLPARACCARLDLVPTRVSAVGSGTK